MMRKHHPLLRAAVLLLWTAACWRLFVPALDVPTQELRANALASMQGTLLLLLLAGAWLLLRLLPGLDTTPWRAVPFLCLGVGCGLFGGGTGELLAVQAMKKHPELQKQNEIAERDERNVAIGNAAKAKGYDVMTFAFGAMLLFSVLMEADLALTLVMVAVYLFIQFYSLWWRFKLEKEM